MYAVEVRLSRQENKARRILSHAGFKADNEIKRSPLMLRWNDGWSAKVAFKLLSQNGVKCRFLMQIA